MNRVINVGLLVKRRLSMTDKFYFLLFALGIVLFLLSVVTFYPGHFSNDTRAMHLQAISMMELSDWHSVYMTLAWRFMIITFGRTGTMLLLHQVLLWGALILLAAYVYKAHRNKTLSLTILLIGITPHVFTISGIVWKDVHLALVLLILMSILYIYPVLENKKLKLAFKVFIFGLFLYAFGLRHNAVLAVLPISALIAYSVLGFRKLRSIILSVVMMVLVGIGSVSIVEYIFDVRQSYVGSAVMVDDLVALLNPSQINALSIPEQQKQNLIEIELACTSQNTRRNTMLSCLDRNKINNHVSTHFDGLTKAWVSSIAQNPVKYIKFRLNQFHNFLNVNGVYNWSPPLTQDRNGRNYEIKNPLNNIAKLYARLSERDFAFMYKPYFWLILGFLQMVLLIKGPNRVNDRIYIFCFAFTASGLLYIFSYLPAAIVDDYRMIYWSTLSISLSLLLYVNDIINTRSSKSK